MILRDGISVTLIEGWYCIACGRTPIYTKDDAGHPLLGTTIFCPHCKRIFTAQGACTPVGKEADVMDQIVKIHSNETGPVELPSFEGGV